MPLESAANDATVLATTRILSAWLSEEGSLEKEVCAVMPLLIDMSRYKYLFLLCLCVAL